TARRPLRRPHGRRRTERALIGASARCEHRHRPPPDNAVVELPCDIPLDREEIPSRARDRIDCGDACTAQRLDQIAPATRDASIAPGGDTGYSCGLATRLQAREEREHGVLPFTEHAGIDGRAG